MELGGQGIFHYVIDGALSVYSYTIIYSLGDEVSP